jgi:hypothetical protein
VMLSFSPIVHSKEPVLVALSFNPKSRS